MSFYRPGRSFPAFSVTGGRCDLQCDHCRGRYLHGMKAVSTPTDLVLAAREVVSEGGTGFLLSGGCDHHGKVPLGPFLGAVRSIKATTPLAINLHTGLLDESMAAEMTISGADAFSVDVVQDRTTIQTVLHLEAVPGDYSRTLALLAPSRRLVPHVCVGLQSEEGERDTLELIRSFKVKALIVLGLMGTKGTPWDGRSVSPTRLSSFIHEAVDSVSAPVLLGCMRPRGQWEVEVKAIEDGIAGLVNPSPRTVGWAEGKGLDIGNYPTCCALHL